MKNKLVLVSFILGAFFSLNGMALAQNENGLNYGNNVVIDSDLDGLTDLGEREIYKTEAMDPDTDGDGFLDGVEVIRGTNPLDGLDPVATKIISIQETVAEKEIPLAWYVSRASGLIAYFLLWCVMFFGLAIRTPILKDILQPIFSLETHRWLSVQALFFVFLHAGALLWDEYLDFGMLDLIVPFYSESYSSELALGILGLYLMIILIITSYFKKFISFRIWRAVHFLNIALFVLVVIHALWIGSDLKSGLLLRNIFIGANGLLGLVIVVNLGARVKNTIFARRIM